MKCWSCSFSDLTFSKSLTLHFLGTKPGRLRFLLVLHSQLFGARESAEFTFPSGLSRPPREDALCLHEQYKSSVRALSVFHVTRGILVSLSLSPSFLYTFFSVRLTNSKTEAFCHSTSLHPPRILAQVRSDGTLGCHRLSSFPSALGALWPKGPLGRYLGDTPSSSRVSLFARSKD